MNSTWVPIPLAPTRHVILITCRHDQVAAALLEDLRSSGGQAGILAMKNWPNAPIGLRILADDLRGMVG